MKKRIALVLATTLAGCGHMTVEKGLEVAQDGMAVVDVGVDKLGDRYIAAVNALRAYCNGNAECEKKYRVTDEDTAKVADAVEELSKVYDATAETLSTVDKTWKELAPVVEQLESDVKRVR